MKIISVDGKIPTVSGKAIKAVGSGGVEDVEWHQCPQLVRDYLDNVTYNPNDYTTSQIANYAPATAVASNTKPIGKTVDGVTFYNEIPNAKTPFATENKAGTLKPLDFLRWINTANAVNVRDIGGWTCDGGTVKYGLMFRGGELTYADRGALVGDCDVRHDIDLRGSAVSAVSSPLGTDIHYIKTTGDLRYSLADTDDWATVIRTIFDAVAHREPVYVHCSQGADRTGTVFFVLELLLGVAQNDCDKDYELSCFGRNNTYWGTRATASYIPKLIGEINEVYGNGIQQKVINWIFSLGFTDAEMNAFRKAMIDGNPQDISHSVEAANLVPTSTDANGNIYNGTGYKEGYRLNSSGTETAASGSVMCGFIPFDKTKTYRVKGVQFGQSVNAYVSLFDSSYAQKAWVNSQPAYMNPALTTNGLRVPPTDQDGNYVIWDGANLNEGNQWLSVTNATGQGYIDASAFFRISAVGIGTDFVVTEEG